VNDGKKITRGKMMKTENKMQKKSNIIEDVK